MLSDDVAIFMVAGADFVLSKPLRISELEKSIEEYRVAKKREEYGKAEAQVDRVEELVTKRISVRV